MSVMSLVAAMGTTLPDDNTLEEKFAPFELELTRYEKATGDELPDMANIGILVAAATGRLHARLVLHLGDLITYGHIRSTVISYAKSKKPATRNPRGDPTPVDADGIRAKGVGTSNKYRAICRRGGHWASE